MDDATERLISDVGRHAADQAVKAMARVIATVPGGFVKAMTMAVALGILQHKIDGLLELDEGDSASALFRGAFARAREAYNDQHKDLIAELKAAKGKEIDEVARRHGIDPLDI